ncbi:MAG: SPOR domain-containing protein [Burkholderiales bacterium]
MAKAVSAEEIDLRKRARRRLVGAIALVLLAVIFLPMVLDKEPKPVTQDVVIQIPSQNQGQFVSKIVPVAPETKAPVRAEPQPADKDLAKSEAGILSPKSPATTAAAPKAAETPPPAAKPAPAEPAKPKAETKPPAKAAAPAKAEVKPAPPAAAPAGQFVVQVAALSDTAKAQVMKEQIAAAGYAAYTESVPTASGPVMRVRAGPFATRAAAEAARDKLKAAGMAGNVTTK